MTTNFGALPLRRLADCWDYLRIPLNAEERSERPGPIPYWGANTIQGFVDTALVNDDVVLIGEDGAPFFDRDRPVAFRVEGPIWPNNHIHVLKARPEVDPRWLAYALNDVDYSLHVGGSTRDKLTQASMMRIEVPTPDHAAQEAIADYLDRETAQIDTLIVKQEQLIATLRERRAAIWSHHFASALNKSHTSIRRVLRPLSRPASPGLGVVTVYRDGTVTLRSNRRTDGYTVSYTESGYQEIRRGDLVFHALDGFAGAVGVSDSRGNGSPVYHVCETLNGNSPEYVARLLRFLGTSGFLSQQAPNVRERSIDFRNWQTFARVPLELAPTADQTRLVERLSAEESQIDGLIARAERFIDLSKERRAALISATVTGRIDVSGEAA